jgi:hypothetical protein
MLQCSVCKESRFVPNVREGERERQGNMPCRVATKRFHALGYIRMGAKKL